ncbi:MAG: hypothetical protein WCP95_13710 [Actinomycetes bacterium]
MRTSIRTSSQVRRSANIRTSRSVARSTSGVDLRLEEIARAVADLNMKAKRAEQDVKDRIGKG